MTTTDDDLGGIDPGDVIRRSHEAFVVMDDAGVVRAWAGTAETMFGYSEQEAVGSRLSELIIPAAYRELHERGLRRYLETGSGPVLGTTIQIEGVDRSGRLVPVELTIKVASSSGGIRFHAFLADITARRRVERALRAEAALAWLCADRPGAVLVNDVLAAIGEEMCFQVGLAWLASADDGVLHLRGRWVPSTSARSFALDSQQSTFRPGEGLPGRVWEAGAPLWSSDVSVDPDYLRRAEAATVGFRSGLLVPVGRGSECRGVLELLSPEWQAMEDDLIQRFGTWSDRLGAHLLT